MRYIISISFLFYLLASVPVLASVNVEEVRVSNGVKAWMIQDSSLPIVAIKVAFLNSGSAYDPEGKEGLANIAVHMMDEGAGDLSGIALKNILEEKAISFYVTSDEDNVYIHMKTLKEHLGEAFNILRLVLTEPNFAEADFKRVREQISLSIEKRKESPDFIANQRWNQIAYGSHPYARDNMGSRESLLSISKDDLIDYMYSNFAKDNLVISAVGDISQKELASYLDSAFDSLTKKQSVRQSILAELKVLRPADKQPVVIPFDISQSIAIFGFKGLKRNDPYFYPAYLMNHILGNGGFDSRLMNEVREKRGLAYSVYSYMATFQYGGVIKGYVATENHRIKKSIDIIKKEIKKIQNKAITQRELDDAKNYLVGSFPLRLDNNASLANFLLFMQIEELGMDFLEERNNLINAVTLKQVNAISEKLLHIDNMITVVVGSWPGQE